MGARIRAALLGILAAAMILLPAAGAQAAPMSPAMASNAALDWAEVHATGHPYIWAGVGPYGYDCSGLVVAAFAREGIILPHNTVAMIDSGKLVRVYSPRRGDLAFWGSVYAPEHVEFVTRWWHTTFGAQEPGTVVWWHTWNGWWEPSSFWEVV